MSKILPIITYPNPILRQKSAKIKRITPDIKQLILDMKKTMLEKEGVGLSAPQVGKNIRLVVINTKDGPLHMLNPRITRKSWFKEWNEEGCLSFPGIFIKVKRKKKIKVVYRDKDNKKIKLKTEGLLARVIQHEVDHLNGILFIDYLPARQVAEALGGKKSEWTKNGLK